MRDDPAPRPKSPKLTEREEFQKRVKEAPTRKDKLKLISRDINFTPAAARHKAKRKLVAMKVEEIAHGRDPGASTTASGIRRK